MKHLLQTACICLGILLSTHSVRSQTCTPPSGSCPNLSACTYVPLRYFTFDNSCAVNNDCINPATQTFANATAILSNLSGPSPVVGGFSRVTTSSFDIKQSFGDNFYPNGDYVTSGKFTFEFLFRLNSDYFDEIKFSLRKGTEFTIRPDEVWFQVPYLAPGATTVNSVGIVSTYLTGTGIASPAYFLDRSWHHIVCKFDGAASPNGSVELWIDGQCPAQLTATVPTGSTPHNIAYNPIDNAPNLITLGLQDDGTIDLDEVVFYDEALPAAVIYQHYLNTTNGLHYECNADPAIVVPSFSNPLSGTYDHLDYAPNHSFDLAGVPETLDDLGTVPLVVEQFKDFPLPRYRKEHTLNQNINWMNNEYMAKINKVENGPNDVLIQEELSKHWNYMFNLSPNALFRCNYQNLLNTFANSHSQYKYSICTNLNQIVNLNTVSNLPDLVNPVSSCSGGYIWFGQTGYFAPNDVTEDHFDTLGKTMFRRMRDLVINDPLVPLTRIIAHVSENGHEFGMFSGNSSGCPYTDLSQLSLNLFPNTFPSPDSWERYYGWVRNRFETTYRNNIIGQHTLIPSGTKYSKYLVSSIIEREGSEDYVETRSVNTPYINSHGDTNYYSTPPFYVPYVNKWGSFMGPNWTWKLIIKNGSSAGGGGRAKEISVYHDSLFAPFVSPGWQTEHWNVRPGQWLGLLKGLGVLGADYYHTGYFNETVGVGIYPTGTGSPVDPRGWCYQAVMPSYAQGITSRFEKYLHASDIAYHKMANMTLFVARHLTGTTKYLLYGSAQQLNNLIGNAPLSVNYHISDATAGATLNGLTFNIRRQGSTYIYDSATNLFYQLDKWHESTHPSYWSKDFEFEAELNDYTGTNTNANDLVNTTMSLKTVKPANSSVDDYTDYTTYIEYLAPSAPVKSYYYFEPRDPSGNGSKTYYLWMRANISLPASDRGKMDVTIRQVGGSIITQQTMPCIGGHEFWWYNYSVPQGQLFVTPGTFSFSVPANEEYEIEFTAVGNKSVLFDKFILSESSGFPVGVPITEVAVACPLSNRPALGLSENESETENLTIYPNPGKGNFFVKIDGSNPDKNFIKEIRVLNTQGLVIYQSKFNTSTTREVEISLGENKNGMYIVETKTTQNLTRTKIVIAK